jgi:outer membrane protein assembly factor BamD
MNRLLRVLLIFTVFSTSLVGFISCSGKSIDESNVTELLAGAEEDISDKRYIFALEKLRALKNKFPYSNLAITAQLRIADVHFLDENFIEASSAYETFRDLHPKHEKSDYVQFRIAESYYFQLPSTIDRDLSSGYKAVSAYEELNQLYPKSEYLPTAIEHKNDTLERLSQKEKYIADFYFTRSKYESAQSRYEKIIQRYSGTKHEESSYWKLAQCFFKLSKKDDLYHLSKVYENRFPKGKYISSIEKRIKTLEERKSSPQNNETPEESTEESPEESNE